MDQNIVVSVGAVLVLRGPRLSVLRAYSCSVFLMFDQKHVTVMTLWSTPDHVGASFPKKEGRKFPHFPYGLGMWLVSASGSVCEH